MPSEFDLIARYFARPTPQAVLGPGDDCALLAPSAGMELAITTDMLVAGTHFLPDTDPRQLGWKTLAVNLSDLAAMGAKPRWVLLAGSLPEADEDWLAAFADGLFAGAKRYGVDLVGDYRQDIGAYGNLKYSAGFNWNTTQIDDIHASAVAAQALGPDGGYERQRQGNLKYGLPQSKLLLGTTWTVDKFEIGLNLTRYGEYTQYGTAEAFDRTFSPAWITDLTIDYHLTPAITLNAGANNLFNKYPERTDLASSSGGFPYGNFSPYGTTGGYWYTGVTYNF